MKKSKFIDYAVLLAALSGRNKRKSIDGLLLTAFEESESVKQEKDENVVAPTRLEIYH
jgi:hypothetical protein